MLRWLMIAALCFTLMGSAQHARAGDESRDAGLPIQDNELLIGGGIGAFIIDEREVSTTEAVQRLRFGGYHELVFVGLMNRATDWLDGELVMAITGLWLAGDGFNQRDRGVDHHAHFLPGFALRATTHLRLPWISPTRIGFGVVGSIYPAPALGTLLRLEVEPSIGVDLTRTHREHLSLDLVYGVALLDDFTEEQGLSIEPWVHRLSLRVAYGF